MNNQWDRNVRWPLRTIIGHLPAHYQDFSTTDINVTLGLGNSRKKTKPHFMNKTGKALLGYKPELAGFCPTEEKQLWARGYQAKKKQEAFIVLWFFHFVCCFVFQFWWFCGLVIVNGGPSFKRCFSFLCSSALALYLVSEWIVNFIQNLLSHSYYSCLAFVIKWETRSPWVKSARIGWNRCIPAQQTVDWGYLHFHLWRNVF